MRRGTTPVINLTVYNYDVTKATDVWVTFEQSTSGTEITRKWKRIPDEDNPNYGIMVVGQKITCKLSQSETLEFVKGKVEVQIKFLENDDNDDTIMDNVAGTVTKKLPVTDILNEDVM